MDIVIVFITKVLNLLPDSPFQSYLLGLERIEELDYLNYFIPLDVFVGIGQAWLTAMGVWYAYSFVMGLVGKAR